MHQDRCISVWSIGASVVALLMLEREGGGRAGVPGILAAHIPPKIIKRGSARTGQRKLQLLYRYLQAPDKTNFGSNRCLRRWRLSPPATFQWPISSKGCSHNSFLQSLFAPLSPHFPHSQFIVLVQERERERDSVLCCRLLSVSVSGHLCLVL